MKNISFYSKTLTLIGELPCLIQSKDTVLSSCLGQPVSLNAFQPHPTETRPKDDKSKTSDSILNRWMIIQVIAFYLPSLLGLGFCFFAYSCLLLFPLLGSLLLFGLLLSLFFFFNLQDKIKKSSMSTTAEILSSC